MNGPSPSFDHVRWNLSVKLRGSFFVQNIEGKLEYLCIIQSLATAVKQRSLLLFKQRTETHLYSL